MDSVRPQVNCIDDVLLHSEAFNELSAVSLDESVFFVEALNQGLVDFKSRRSKRRGELYDRIICIWGLIVLPSGQKRLKLLPA
jgi:hypothetical protein